MFRMLPERTVKIREICDEFKDSFKASLERLHADDTYAEATLKSVEAEACQD